MKKRARVDFKSSCSAYPPTYYSGGHKNIRTAYSLKPYHSIFKNESCLPSLIKNSNPSPSVTYFYSYLRYTSIQDKHRKGYSIKNRAIALPKQVSPLLYGSHLLVYFSSRVYRYRPILSQLPIFYR